MNSSYFLFFILFIFQLTSCEKDENTLSLSGNWQFKTDSADVGIQEKWYITDLSESIHLPGSMQEQGYGDPINSSTKLTGGESINDRYENWKNNPENQQWADDTNTKLPWTWMPDKIYVGPAWYQKKINIPQKWEGKTIRLSLERCHWQSSVWVDSTNAGLSDYLSAPQVFILGDLTPGEHTLTIRVDNRLHINPGAWAHSVSFHTQTNWNGIIGNITLEALPDTFIEDIQIYPDINNQVAKVIITFSQETKTPFHYKITQLSNGKSIVEDECMPAGMSHTIEADMSGVPFWDEFSPELCQIDISIEDQKKSARFGMRSIEQKGRDILINGRKTFFRGTLDCCIFPLTGYPPMDKESWLNIIKKCQSYGLNHIRFHSWCPPGAAFEAADELGFYLQPESSVWTAIGAGNPVDEWLPREAASIIKAFGNHPSFVLFSFGNEFTSNYIPLIDSAIIELKKPAARQLFASHTGQMFPENPFMEKQTDFFVMGHGNMRGPYGWYGKDYTEGLKQHVPEGKGFIVHEMGQWCAFPSSSTPGKMTGSIKDSPTEIVSDRLINNGLYEQWNDFTFASGQWQKQCYKEEIEAAMRTPGYSGFQLLDIHDFPGQGNALVGILDYFYESKGYATPQEFTRFNNSVVPLIRMNDKIFTTNDTLKARVEFFNYSMTEIKQARINWEISSNNEKVLDGIVAITDIALGNPIFIDSLILACNKLDAPAQYKLIINIAEKNIENDWDFWVFPEDIRQERNHVILTHHIHEAINLLEQGKKVLLLPDKYPVKSPYGDIRPFFWNNYFFGPSENGTLGLMIQNRHPALKYFPSDHYTNYQWNAIMKSSRYVDMRALHPSLQPIIQVVDDWNTCRKLGLLFECRLNKGKLLVITSRIDTLKDPASKQLLSSLLDYMNSSEFNPATTLSKEELISCLDDSYYSNIAQTGKAKVLGGGLSSKKLIDGNVNTYWQSSPETKLKPEDNHFEICFEIIIDLGEEKTFRGMRFIPRQDNMEGIFDRYKIQTSNDLDNWGNINGEVIWWGASNRMPKEMWFEAPVTKRYIKLGMGHVHDSYITLGEVDIIE